MKDYVTAFVVIAVLVFQLVMTNFVSKTFRAQQIRLDEITLELEDISSELERIDQTVIVSEPEPTEPVDTDVIDKRLDRLEVLINRALTGRFE